ncbi:MAG: hypothetical protein GY860_06360 [Desulfobacteraceae bacterium]|nr:hypothetical protein [Desulfobacteraceae bacterium]
MAELRTSPIKFNLEPLTVDKIDSWKVVKEYKNQKQGPLLIDLSHRPSWDFQDKDVLSFNKPEFSIPADMNGITRQGNLFVSRMNQTQVQLWSFDGKTPPLESLGPFCTDITDGQAVMALMGNNLDLVFESMLPLEMFKPGENCMQLFQAPLFHIPCQILVLDRSEKMKVVIISCPRGYGKDMTKAILKSAIPHGLNPGGENAFELWLNSAG